MCKNFSSQTHFHKKFMFWVNRAAAILARGNNFRFLTRANNQLPPRATTIPTNPPFCFTQEIPKIQFHDKFTISQPPIHETHSTRFSDKILGHYYMSMLETWDLYILWHSTTICSYWLCLTWDHHYTGHLKSKFIQKFSMSNSELIREYAREYMSPLI